MSALVEVERAMLVSAMLKPAACAGIELDPEHFAAEHHAVVWEAIQRLTADTRPCDPVTVMEYLEAHGKRALSAEVIKWSAETVVGSPSGYADTLKTAWRSRQAMAIAAELAERARSRDETAVDDAIAALMALHRVQRGAEWGMKDAARAAYERLQEVYELDGKLSGIPTGLTDLDEKLGGFHNSDLIVVGARAAMGKTALLLNFVWTAANAGYGCGLISGEQPHEQVGQRVLSMASGVAAHRLRSGHLEDGHWTQVGAALKAMKNLPVKILDRSSPTIGEVIRTARRWKHQDDIKILFVDYIQRIKGQSERRHEEVGQVVRALKDLGRELDIPVVALAQVSRASEGGDKRPRMVHLSDSSEIEKEADQVMLIYRPDYYDPDHEDAGTCEIILDKNRHGPTGFIKVAWLPETMQFKDLARAS